MTHLSIAKLKIVDKVLQFRTHWLIKQLHFVACFSHIYF